MSNYTVKCSRLLSKYLLDDLSDIVLGYTKKCLWEYTMEFPTKEDAGGFDTFDLYLNDSIKHPQKIPASFQWSIGSFFSNPKWKGKDVLLLAFPYSQDVWIPVCKDEHTRVYRYLQQYFEFLI